MRAAVNARTIITRGKDDLAGTVTLWSSGFLGQNASGHGLMISMSLGCHLSRILHFGRALHFNAVRMILVQSCDVPFGYAAHLRLIGTTARCSRLDAE